tara:strand:+ start:4002 stop:4217 length:216 start_codon:yes stop_codon:yes gene_type:complete
MKEIMLKQNGSNKLLMKKNFVVFTPLLGAITFPLIVPITISRFGINYGIISALFISSLWFIAMLRTSEMPH